MEKSDSEGINNTVILQCHHPWIMTVMFLTWRKGTWRGY